MTSDRDKGADPIARWADLPRMEAALARAVREALLGHKQAGNPVAVWRNGQVVWIPPEEIRVDAAPIA